MFAGSTPLPLPLAYAARRAVAIVRRDQRQRRRLQRNSDFVKRALRAAGATLADLPGPIVPLHFPEAKLAARLQRRLRAAGILPPFIRYPGGPAAGYFRFVISSEHTPAQLQNLVRVLTPFVAAAR
jgi:7-keto-8-aminopelargonate synthetase-like enzyme